MMARPVRSDIAWSTETKIFVHDFDFVDELLGTANLGDFAFLELFKRLPNEGESLVFNALLVSLVEHGLTPSSLVTRLTLMGAPESLQAAVAAGLLGLGSTFVGTIEGAAEICQRPTTVQASRDDASIATLAREIVAEHLDDRKPIPGIGHPVHRPVDPRAEKIFALTAAQGLDTFNVRLFRAIAATASERTGRCLPVNVTGAIGAVASTLGVPWRVCRGLGVMARAVGLVGHLLEELQNPIAGPIYYDASERVVAHRVASTSDARE